MTPNLVTAMRVAAAFAAVGLFTFFGTNAFFVFFFSRGPRPPPRSHTHRPPPAPRAPSPPL